jgi:hypothetical protein
VIWQFISCRYKSRHRSTSASEHSVAEAFIPGRAGQNSDTKPLRQRMARASPAEVLQERRLSLGAASHRAAPLRDRRETAKRLFGRIPSLIVIPRQPHLRGSQARVLLLRAPDQGVASRRIAAGRFRDLRAGYTQAVVGEYSAV